MMPYGYGGYGSSGYYSPVPQTFWGSIGSSLGSIGQGLQQWLPMAQMMEQGARQNFDYYLNMPGLTDDQRQQAAQNYAHSTRHLPAFMKLNLIQQNVPGQVTTPGQAAVPGAPSVDQGQAINAPSGALRESVSSEAQAAKPAVAEVRGPSQNRYLLPPQSIQNQSVMQVLGENSPVWQNMPESMKAQIGGMRWSDALQVYPNLAQAAQAQVSPFELDQMVSTLGSSSPIYQIVQRAGFDPSRMTIAQAQTLPGVDIAIARQVEFGNVPGIGGTSQTGQPGQGQQGTTGTTQPSTSSGYSNTQYGYWVPALAAQTSKEAQAFAHRDIPQEFWDYKTGRPDMPAIEAQAHPFIQAPPTAHDVTLEHNAKYQQGRQLVDTLINSMTKITDPNIYTRQSDADNALKRAQATYQKIQKVVQEQEKIGNFTQEEGDAILASIQPPTMPALRYVRPVRGPKGPAPGSIPGNVRVRIDNLAQAIRDSDPNSPQRKALIQRYNAVGAPYQLSWDADVSTGYRNPIEPKEYPPPYQPNHYPSGTIIESPDGKSWWMTDGSQWTRVSNPSASGPSQ